MNRRFFEPFVGSKYNEGIRGKKILVLGASFYCNKDGKNGSEKCEYFAECTNPEKKDSSNFNAICPVYKNSGLLLSEEPSNAISENYKAYQTFAKFIEQFGDNKEDVWQRMAFTDYLQFFSPTIKTKKSYLSNRDFEAFCETLIELQPDIVIAWGMAIIEEIRENNQFVIDKERLPDTEWYVCHIKMPTINHEISLICSYHPAAPKYWYGELDKLVKYMKEELK